MVGAAGFSAALPAAGLAAAGFGAAAVAGFSAAVASPDDFWRAIFMMSATLGRPPPLPTAGFAAGFGSAGGVLAVVASTSTGAAGSAAAVSGALPAPSPPAFWARAAARISATDIFFRSAMLLTFTLARDHQATHTPTLRAFASEKRSHEAGVESTKTARSTPSRRQKTACCLHAGIRKCPVHAEAANAMLTLLCSISSILP